MDPIQVWVTLAAGIVVLGATGSIPTTPSHHLTGAIRPNLRPEEVRSPGVSSNATPFGIAYDPGRGEVFVTDLGAGDVYVLNDTSNEVVAVIPVGVDPEGIAYDPGRGEMFVANYDTSNVSVISDSSDTVVATIPTAVNCSRVAYDSGKSEVFAVNFNGGGEGVSVISDVSNSVVATISVAPKPDAVAYDSAVGEVFVPIASRNSLSIISDSTNAIVKNLSVGSHPIADVASAPGEAGGAEVFVANLASDNVSVISDSTDRVTATVPVGNSPMAVGFDGGRNEVFVANAGSDSASVIDVSSGEVVATVPVGSGPDGVAYDSAKGEIYVANSLSGNVSVINDSSNRVVATIGLAPPASSVTFTESGLPPGASWSVGFGGMSQVAPAGSPIAFLVPAGTYSYLVRSEGPYRISGTAGEGRVTLTGADVERSVTFVRGATFSLILREVGLKVATPWCVAMGSKVCSATPKVAFLHLTPGTYAYAIGTIGGMTTLVRDEAGWTPGSHATSVIARAGVNVRLRFAFAVTFTETGLAGGTTWSVVAQGQTNLSSTSTILLFLTNGTHRFTVPPVSGYLRSPATGTLSMRGTPLNRAVTFRS